MRRKTAKKSTTLTRSLLHLLNKINFLLDKFELITNSSFQRPIKIVGLLLRKYTHNKRHFLKQESIPKIGL